MRKLIFSAIISVIVIIAWISYLNYDTKQFINDLSELPSSVQQSDGTSEQVESLPDIDETITPDTIAEVQNEKGILDIPIRISQTDDSSITPADAANSDREVVTPQLGGNDAELSVEIKTLFVKYKDIFDQYRKVNRELEPLNQQATALTLQLQKDPPSNVKIQIIKQIEVLDAHIIPLQEEVEKLDDASLTLLKEYGFASEDEFYDEYEEIYDVWEADQ